MVGAVVEQVYSGAVTCSRDNTRHQHREMLHFYLLMHQNAFGGRALPRPARPAARAAYSVPQVPVAGLNGEGEMREREGRER